MAQGMIAPFFDRVKVGILGCSDIAYRKFIPALLKSNRAELAAVASRNSDRAATFIPGLKYDALTYEELICHPEAELIYLSLSNDLHEEWVIRSLEHGKHVICEKPLSLSLDATKKMLKSAEERGLLLYENLMYLHHPQHTVIRDFIAAGTIGRIVSLRSVFTFPSPQPGNFRLDPAKGGGVFHDLARYPLGTLLFFLKGEPVEFKGFAIVQNGLDSALHGNAITTADEIFSFTIAFGQQYQSFYEIVGDKGKIFLDRAYTTPIDLINRISITRGMETECVTTPPADQFQLMIDYVCSLIRGPVDYTETHSWTFKLACLADMMEKRCRYGS